MFGWNKVKTALLGQPDPLVCVKEYLADGTLSHSITILQSGNTIVNGCRVGNIDTSLIRNLIHTCKIYDKADRYGDSLSPQNYAKITLNTKQGHKHIHAEASMPTDLLNFVSGVKTVVQNGTQS